MCQAVIFDLDGVIADTHAVHQRAWARLLHEENKERSDEQLSVIRDGTKRAEILKHLFGNLSLEQAKRLGARKEELFQSEGNAIQASTGLVKFLDELQEADVASAVATSASRLRAEWILNHLGLADRFVAVVAGDDVELGKPDPSIFLLAAKHLAVDAAEVLVIEDSPAGVLGAKSAGMKCVGVGTDMWGERLRNSGADYLISSFSEISWVDLLDRIQSVDRKRLQEHS